MAVTAVGIPGLAGIPRKKTTQSVVFSATVCFRAPKHVLLLGRFVLRVRNVGDSRKEMRRAIGLPRFGVSCIIVFFGKIGILRTIKEIKPACPNPLLEFNISKSRISKLMKVGPCQRRNSYPEIVPGLSWKQPIDKVCFS